MYTVCYQCGFYSVYNPSDTQTKKYAVKKKWMMYPVPQEFINIFSSLSKTSKNLLRTLQ